MAGELLDIDVPVEALFTGNNRLTMGTLEALHARGLQVPDDLALVCFDEVPWVTPGFRSLTMVIQPAYELGEAACVRLMQRLEQPGQLTRREIVLAHQFRIGDSSQPQGSRGAGDAGCAGEGGNRTGFGAEHQLIATESQSMPTPIAVSHGVDFLHGHRE
jgi:hypothetical protein